VKAGKALATVAAEPEVNTKARTPSISNVGILPVLKANALISPLATEADKVVS